MTVNIDYFSHTGLEYEQIKDLKAMIDENTRLPHKYFVTMTWVEHPKWGWTLNGPQFEQRREQQIIDYFQCLAHRTGSHLLTHTVISRPIHVNKHFHSLVESEKPISAIMGKRWWKEGTSKDWQAYDKDYGVRYHGDEDRNCLQYM